MDDALRVSTLMSQGLDGLRRAIVSALTGSECLQDPAAISNIRHVSLLKEVRSILAGVSVAVSEESTPEEFVLVDLHRARASLAEVVGVGSSDETLDYIFEHFCIGK
jgi:tRNA modification GTPase